MHGQDLDTCTGATASANIPESNLKLVALLFFNKVPCRQQNCPDTLEQCGHPIPRLFLIWNNLPMNSVF